KREFQRLTKERHLEKLAGAKALAREVSAIFDRVDVKTRPLGGDDLVELLREGLAPTAHTIEEIGATTIEVAPATASARALSLRERLFEKPIYWGDDHLRIGDRYFKVLSMKALPDATEFTLMEVFL